MHSSFFMCIIKTGVSRLFKRRIIFLFRIAFHTTCVCALNDLCWEFRSRNQLRCLMHCNGLILVSSHFVLYGSFCTYSIKLNHWDPLLCKINSFIPGCDQRRAISVLLCDDDIIVTSHWHIYYVRVFCFSVINNQICTLIKLKVKKEIRFLVTIWYRFFRFEL